MHAEFFRLSRGNSQRKKRPAAKMYRFAAKNRSSRTCIAPRGWEYFVEKIQRGNVLGIGKPQKNATKRIFLTVVACLLLPLFLFLCFCHYYEIQRAWLRHPPRRWVPLKSAGLRTIIFLIPKGKCSNELGKGEKFNLIFDNAVVFLNESVKSHWQKQPDVSHW